MMTEDPFYYERKLTLMIDAFLRAFPGAGVVNSHWRCPVVVDEALDPQEWKLLGLSEQIGDTVPPKMDIGDFRSGR